MFEQSEIWSAIKKFMFIVLAIYIFIYIFPYPINWIVPLAGKYIFHFYDLRNKMTGSGDTIFDYVRLFVISMLSILLTTIFLFIMHKKKNYLPTIYWFYLIIRYYLSLMMLLYGFSKIFKSQFPFPSITRLEESFGNSSPMGLLWTFMGYSTSYTIFSGITEIMGGILLLFRKTTALGALIIIIVMSNITMLNFAYDVPVKLHSLHLLFFAIILLIPNAKVLYNFFILNKSASLYSFQLPIILMKERTIYVVTKSVVIMLLFGGTVYLGNNAMNEYGDSSMKPLLYGVYDTQTFILNKDTLLPLTTDSVRWQKLIIGHGKTRIVQMNGKSQDYVSDIDTINKEIIFISILKKGKKTMLSYNNDDNFLRLSGNWEGDSVNIKFSKFNINKYPLIERKFHWINEYPINQ